MNLFRRKNIVDLQAEAESDHSLKRALGALNLTALGVGGIIGTGIFVLTGTVAAQNAGPAVIFSFVLAGIASIFAALCYSEFASLVPMAGSAYTYSYATLGELFAWIIGWDLVLEYAVGAITVGIGSAAYIVSLLKSVTQFLHAHGIGISLDVPPQLAAAAGSQMVQLPDQGWVELTKPLEKQLLATGVNLDALPHMIASFNLPAVIMIAMITTLLVIGIKESARFNSLIVLIKLSVIILFIFGAWRAINPNNWHPFFPPNTGKPENFGWSGMVNGAGTVFFAYIGFDAISTAAQEARNPQRDMPIAIIGSLLLCTVLYILVASITTGVVPYLQLDVPDPIAVAADRAHLGWMSFLIKLGAVAGCSSVLMVMLLGQSRVFYTMSRDGLLPQFVARVHPHFKTPWVTTIITGVIVAFFSARLTVREAGNLCSIGTLLAFVIVSIGVLVLRIREPDLPRNFKTPWVWFVAPMGAITSFYLMKNLTWPTWWRLIFWFAIGMVIYFSYSIRKSKLANPAPVGSSGLVTPR